MPAAAVTATHHQCPPNQPGLESVLQRDPSLIIPRKASPANAPNTPRAAAYPMSTQNSRPWVTGGSAAGEGVSPTNLTIAKPNYPTHYVLRMWA